MLKAFFFKARGLGYFCGMKANFLTVLLITLTSCVFAQPVATKEFPFKMTVQEYLEKYSAIAVEEMHRSRIPASITLAQGLLESGNGNSRLALQANNHFGIKCKKDWTGESIKEDDDEAQECFRKYPTARDSYRDHSDFLMKNARYAFLFDLEPTDYKSWAKGLKQAGYATNPRYPELLISLIERFSLFKYDSISATPIEVAEIKEEQKQQVAAHRNITVNGIPAMVAKADDSYASIALENDMRVWQIYKYNDLQKDAVLKAGDTIFIKPKNYRGSVEFYKVNAGDNMQIISQRFGIKLSKLYSRNMMKDGQEPEVGETIYLQSNRNAAPVLRKVVVEKQDSTYNTIIYDDPKKNVETTRPVLPEDAYQINIPDNKNDMAFFHTVQKGETLFSIAKKYNVTVEGLKELNKLKSNEIAPATRLIINPNQPAVNDHEESVVPGYHVVKQGETLYSIARKYNTSVQELTALNELVNNTVTVGQELVIVPLNGEKVEEKEPDLNSTEPIYHTVKEKETLYSISRKYNVPVEAIRKLNNMMDNTLSVGQKLRVR
jgi:LysM repeat protein